MKTVMIDGVEFRKVESPSDVKILVLNRGWVLVGRPQTEGEYTTISDCSVIRVWGTTKGLGEIAAGGPTSKTILDKCPNVTVHVSQVVLTMNCNGEAWTTKL